MTNISFFTNIFPALSNGVSTDQHYPTLLQKDIARWIPGAQYAEIDSIHGHDAFLIEFGQFGTAIARFLETVWRPAPVAVWVLSNKKPRRWSGLR